MSQENLEVVRRVTEAMDNEGFEAAFAVFEAAADANVEWREDPSWPDGGTYRGLERVRGLVVDRLDSFDFAQDTEALIHVDDKVVALVQWRGRGRASGAQSGMKLAIVWTLRERAITKVEFYLDRPEALEAVGMSEWANAEQQGLGAEAGYGALNSGDLEAFLALTAEDVEFTSMVAEAEGTTFRGHDGVRSWWETVRGAFEDVHWELLDVRGSRDRGVIHFRMTGTLGGVPVEQTMWQATTLRDGQITWWAFFRTEREALEAVGLSD
jgi:ketosteroid isomerase-like protein